MDAIIRVEATGFRNIYIKIWDTAFDQSVVVNKMKLSASVDHCTRDEINALREKFALMDAADGSTASVAEALT